METNRSSNQGAPRLPGEEGGGTPWEKVHGGADGMSGTIPGVTISGADGWIAVHADEGGAPGVVLGYAPTRENTSGGVPATVAR